MNAKVKLCRTDAVHQGSPVGIDVTGLPPLAVYSVDGEYFVTSNICTHGQATLTDGYQEGATIECPFHGGAFDVRTGAAIAHPCRVAIQTFAVHLEDGWVTIEQQTE